MAAPSLPERLVVLAIENGPIEPGLFVVCALLAIVLVLLAAYRPPLPQWMVFALLPWIVAGALLDVVSMSADYPTYLEPLVSTPGVYLAAVCVPGLAWVTMLNVAVTRRGLPPYHAYLGTMGLGVVVVLLPVLAVVRGGVGLEPLVVLAAIPLIAVLAAGLVSLGIGLWSPDFVQYTPIIGGSAVFGAMVNGIATIVAVAAGGVGGHTLVSASVAYVVVYYLPNGVFGMDGLQLWATLLVALYAFLGVVVASQPARFEAARPRAVYAIQGVVAVLWFGVGFDRLLQVVA